MTDAFLRSPLGARVRSPLGAFIRKERPSQKGRIVVVHDGSTFDGVSGGNIHISEMPGASPLWYSANDGDGFTANTSAEFALSSNRRLYCLLPDSGTSTVWAWSTANQKWIPADKWAFSSNWIETIDHVPLILTHNGKLTLISKSLDEIEILGESPSVTARAVQFNEATEAWEAFDDLPSDLLPLNAASIGTNLYVLNTTEGTTGEGRFIYQHNGTSWALVDGLERPLDSGGSPTRSNPRGPFLFGSKLVITATPNEDSFFAGEEATSFLVWTPPATYQVIDQLEVDAINDNTTYNDGSFFCVVDDAAPGIEIDGIARVTNAGIEQLSTVNSDGIICLESRGDELLVGTDGNTTGVTKPPNNFYVLDENGDLVAWNGTTGTATSSDAVRRIFHLGPGELIDSEEIQPPGLTITAIDPATGPVAGGTSVTITGTGFNGGLLTVMFSDGVNSEPGTSISVVSDTEATCDTPGWTHGTGAVDVIVGYFFTATTDTLESGFTYT